MQHPAGGAPARSSRARRARILPPLLLLATAAALPGPADGAVLFRGDFETGTLAQWKTTTNAKRFTLLQTPVREGRWGARLDLRPEDLGPSDQRRAELIYNPPAAGIEGADHHYAFSMMPSTDLPLSAGSHWIAFFETIKTNRPVMTFDADGAKITLRAFLVGPNGKTLPSTGKLWSAAFMPGVWHDFVLHVKWSTDPKVGFVELWYNGVQVVNRTSVQTLPPVEGAAPHPASLHLGILNRNSSPATQALLIDGVFVTTTLQEALRPPAPGSPVPQPVDAAVPRPPSDAGAPAEGDAGDGTPDPDEDEEDLDDTIVPKPPRGVDAAAPPKGGTPGGKKTPPAGEDRTPAASGGGAGGCSAAPGAPAGALAWLLAAAGLAARAARRRRP